MGAASSGHTHDDRYYTESEINTSGGTYTQSGAYKVGAFDEFANSNAGNVQDVLDDLDAAISGKSSSGHTHDDRYYTESETNTLLNAKSNTSHNHDGTYQPADADLTDLADGSLTGSKVGTGINADNITVGEINKDRYWGGKGVTYSGGASDTSGQAGTPKMAYGKFLIGNAGDVTVTLPFSWANGGYLRIVITNHADAWGGFIDGWYSECVMEASYDSLTHPTYAGGNVVVYMNTQNRGLSKTTDEAGIPKSATATTITFNQRGENGGNMRYIKWWVTAL